MVCINEAMMTVAREGVCEGCATRDVCVLLDAGRFSAADGNRALLRTFLLLAGRLRWPDVECLHRCDVLGELASLNVC